MMKNEWKNLNMGDELTYIVDEFGLRTEQAGTVTEKHSDHLIVTVDGDMHIWLDNWTCDMFEQTVSRKRGNRMDCRTYGDFWAVIHATDFMKTATDDEINDFIEAMAWCEAVTPEEYTELYEEIIRRWNELYNPCY